MSKQPSTHVDIHAEPDRVWDGRAMTLRPRLVTVDPDRALRWRGRLGVPGLMDAEHCFVLRPHPGGTRLVHRETFRGVLVPFVAASLDRDTLPAFEAMNEALEGRVEGRPRTPVRTADTVDGSDAPSRP